MRTLAYALLACLVTFVSVAAARGERWTAAQVAELESLWIGSLDSPAPDPTNRVADDERAVALGHRLFFDTRLSSNGRVSCATCHRAEREFQDDVALATGVGTTDRRTMPIAGTAHAPFLFWDGRKDSQWAQALGPLESAVEHGGSRAQYAHIIAEHYRTEYEALFGPLPDLRAVPAAAGPVPDVAARAAWEGMEAADRDNVTRVFVNIGKAIAAYERRIDYGPSRVDRYIAALVETGAPPQGVLSPDEIAGMRLFIGKASCTQCHNGPLLTNNEFHNTGVAQVATLPFDAGRAAGAPKVLDDEFNCRSRWSDAAEMQCSELEFLVSEGHELERAFKVPSLRNVAERAPYMHAGQLGTLTDVLIHYNAAPQAPAGHTELKPLRLNARELRQLEAYLRALSGGTDAPAHLLREPVRD
jgi:cytochrome c peroxidase